MVDGWPWVMGVGKVYLAFWRNEHSGTTRVERCRCAEGESARRVVY